MDAIKAGIEKTKEVLQIKKAEEKTEKSVDPNAKPSERIDAAFEADKATMKAHEHAGKSECHKDKHISH